MLAKAEQAPWHEHCFACGAGHPQGLHLRCRRLVDGSVMGSIYTAAWMQGYPDKLHGGIVAGLLDSAMCQCLHLHGHAAVTAELAVRFRHPVLLGKQTHVHAWLTQEDPHLFRLQGELLQDGIIKAAARAAFMPPKPAGRAGDTGLISCKDGEHHARERSQV